MRELPSSGNLYRDATTTGPEERLDVLAESGLVRIERIVSHGSRSPVGFWYDQDDDEWVLLVAGQAALEFEGQPEQCRVQRGDWIFIPAHRRHRVAWTSPTEDTIWLAVFCRSP